MSFNVLYSLERKLRISQNQNNQTLHLPIHCLYMLILAESWWSWGLFPEVVGEKQVTPWTGHKSNTDTLTPKDNLDCPISPTLRYLTGRTCKQHAERPQAGIWIQDSLAVRQRYYQVGLHQFQFSGRLPIFKKFDLPIPILTDTIF